MDSRPSAPQLFARGQGKPFQTGPFLGGYAYVMPASVAASGTIVVPHTLRTNVRHLEVVSPILGEYPSRVAITVNGAAQITVRFESAQSAGGVLFLW